MSSSETRDGHPEPAVEEAFDRLVEEGQERLERPLLAQVSTGLLGGIDVGFGILAYLVVEKETGEPLLASLAFGVGFVALLLARSELFTENFLVPVTSVVARHGTWWGLARLWAVTALTNLLGGALVIWLLVTARPDLEDVVVENGLHYAGLGVSGESLALAVLAGAVITLMTRMQHATESLGVKIVPALLLGPLLVGAQLFHCILDTVLVMGAMMAGADIGLGTLVQVFAWAALGNVLGGIGLVTAIRLLRVRRRVAEARAAV
ncbi:formate/nitrite transporter family protein [Nocardioides sp. GY 10127]|uniref:formate/nitrite transporter family protein n=1 Tax=Nocardioides sp. GY 10127 TaxID=2569762 RepID=UPI0010A762D7|nr:formate/nitrite transporter family protein [Nocardioides sp. GY 10127]TIC80021.1 formate/nitrite transporter family protein [Nocardioides sp. GY 10127]